MIYDDLIKLKSKGHRLITQWMNLNNRGREKVAAIERSSLYMAFPCEFNDIFDSQVRLTDAKKEELSVAYSVNGRPCHVGFYQDVLSSAQIACFSLFNPLSLESNHMWGLYGASGSGIALQYGIDDLIEFFSPLQGLSSVKWFEVNYKPGYCPAKGFEDYIKLIHARVSGLHIRQEEIKKALDVRASTKQLRWADEQEIRLISTEYVLEHFHDVSHPFHGNGILYSQDDARAHQLLVDHRSNHKKKLLQFIKPAAIILGWNCKDSFIPRFRHYTSRNDIALKRLKKLCDYDKGEFIAEVLDQKRF